MKEEKTEGENKTRGFENELKEETTV